MPKTFNVGSRSLVVNLTAWFAIALAVVVCGLAGLQHAQLASTQPQWQSGPLPVLAAWLLRHLPSAVNAAAALSLLLGVVAAGLLLRLEWARRAFIGLAALAMTVSALGLWLQHEVVQALVHHTLRHGGLPIEAVDMFGGLATAAQVLGVLVTLSACVLIAWVIRQLMSDPVRQEFA